MPRFDNRRDFIECMIAGTVGGAALVIQVWRMIAAAIDIAQLP